MGKITYRVRTFLVLLFLLGSSLTLLTAKTTKSAEISISGSVQNVSCLEGSDGAINTTVSGGNGIYTITWTGTNQTSEDITGLSAGSYTITVTDTEGVTESKDFSVTEPAPLQVSTPSTTDVTCNGVSDGSITAGTVSGGTAPYEYSINNSTFGSNTTFTGLSSGNYTIYIQDSQGCTTTQPATVSQPDVLTMAAPTTTAVSCNGGNDGAITAGAVSGGNTDYQYSKDGINFTTSNSFTSLTAGSYTITVKDSKGCTTTQPATVSQPDVLTMAAPTTTAVSCNGDNDGTITAGTVSGGNTGYQYSKDGTNFTTSNSFTGLTAGSYTITVKDSKGCETTQSVTVEQPEALTMAEPTSTPISCNGGNDGSITAGAVVGGNTGYQYSKDGTNFTTSNSFTGLTAGSYNITVKDSKGCIATETVTVIQPEALIMDTPTSTPVSCNGGNDGSITAGTVAGGNTGYQYSKDGTNFSTSNSFSGLTAGSYTITVKDSKGCTTTQPATVSQPDVLTMAAPTTTAVSCNGGNDGTITAGTVSGGNTDYQYSKDGTNFSTSNSFTGLTAGSYNITVKDSKGCIATETVTVIQPEALIMETPAAATVSCNGGNDGTITAGEVSGGNGGYQYSKDGINYSTTKIFSGYSAGTHKVYVRDAKGCVAEQTVIITQPDVLSMSASTSTQTTCFEGSDGTVTAGTVIGGNGEYLYSIDNTNFDTGNTFTGLPAGTHTVFVKDSKGCALQQTITVTQPEKLKASTAKTDVKCFGGDSGTITISNPTGGSNNYEYSINEQDWITATTFTGLIHGSYNVYIRDKDNPSCVIMLQEAYQINQPSAALDATVETTRTTTFGTATASATANPTGGTPGYTYEWRFTGESQILQTTKTATNLAAGNYEVTIKDLNGCLYIEEFVIIDALEAFIISKSLCEGDETTIRTTYFEVENQTAVGGIAPYIYDWDFGEVGIDNKDGIGEHQVIYNSTGNKTITLTITDITGATFTVVQQQYVGKCYEPCGKSNNIIFDPDNFYIGDVNGVPIDVVNNCDANQDKYIFLQVDKSANAYNPYIELVYVVTDSDGNSTPTFVRGCRDGADIDDDLSDTKDNKIGEFIKFTVDPISFSCGKSFSIENFYITWTNVSKKDCGQNNNAFCYSIDEPLVLPTEVKAEAIPNEILCKGDTTGIINVKASGGFAPYTYSLTAENTSYQTSNQFINLAAGDYIVYVKDARGNTAEAIAVIMEPSSSISADVIPENPLCFGETGAAIVRAKGGTPFLDPDNLPYYKYLWNDVLEQTTVTADSLNAGNYTVTIIDANGCQIIETVTITEPEQLTVAEAGEDQIFNCGFNTTTLEANTPETGIGTWTLVSGAGGTIAEPENPGSEFTGTAGTYTLRWTIAHADGTCTTSDDVEVTFVPDCSTLDFDGTDDHIVFGDNYGLTAGAFSIEAWVKLKSASGVKTILSKRNAANLGAGGYDLIINNGAPTFRWGNSSVSTSSKLGTQRWYHIAVLFNGSIAELYVDGIRVGNATATNPSAINEPFLMGAMHDSNNPEIPQNYFNGWIEEVRMWKTALTKEQLRFMMNQRLKVDVNPVRGTVLPLDVPGSLDWTNLQAYYQLLPEEIENGFTLDKATNKINGELKNIETTQENTAPLPYFSAQNTTWTSKQTWLRPDVWDFPNSTGINGQPIDWNIVSMSHDITSGGRNITLLGLLSEAGDPDPEDSKLTMEGSTENGTGNGLTITHYLKLDGVIDLEGESQLIQTDIDEPNQTIISVLEEASKGYIERDQQGTANSFNYNYWSSPVSLQDAANNSTYTVASVMLDGSPTSNNGKPLSFNDWHEYADYSYAANSPRRISNFWINKFRGTSNVYSEWKRIGSTGILSAGEGYTMKGTSGDAAISDPQNYIFKGKPNNGTITLDIGKDQNYLLGNPYPSAIDVNKFILDNLNSADVNGATNTKNVFNGALYFWDHFAGKSHILLEYIGGYATRNLTGGVKAASTDERINANDTEGTKVPGQFIPVAQGFFINTVLDPDLSGDYTVDGGDVIFKNSQRAFVRETDPRDSQFLRPENPVKMNKQSDTRSKIRLDFRSPMGYHRQILVGVDPNTTNGFDLGYDAPINDYNKEDMFWLINGNQYVIQGVPNFNLDQVLALGIRIEKEGEFSIKINDLENVGDEVSIFLKDSLTNTYYDLRESEVKINLTKGEIIDRFEIVFQKEKESTPDPNEETDPNENPGEEPDPNEGTDPDPEENPGKTLPPGTIDVIFAENNHQLRILNPDNMNIQQVEIFNLLGQKIEIYTTDSNQKQLNFQVQDHPSAIYVVKVFAKEGMVSKNILMMK